MTTDFFSFRKENNPGCTCTCAASVWKNTFFARHNAPEEQFSVRKVHVSTPHSSMGKPEHH